MSVFQEPKTHGLPSSTSLPTLPSMPTQNSPPPPVKGKPPPKPPVSSKPTHLKTATASKFASKQALSPTASDQQHSPSPLVNPQTPIVNNASSRYTTSSAISLHGPIAPPRTKLQAVKNKNVKKTDRESNEVFISPMAAPLDPAMDTGTETRMKRREQRRQREAEKDAEIVAGLQEICTDADPTKLYRNMLKIGQG